MESGDGEQTGQLESFDKNLFTADSLKLFPLNVLTFILIDTPTFAPSPSLKSFLELYLH